MGRMFFNAEDKDGLTSFKEFMIEFTGKNRYMMMIIGKPTITRIIIRPSVTSRLDTAVLKLIGVSNKSLPDIVNELKGLWKDKIMFLSDFKFDDEK